MEIQTFHKDYSSYRCFLVWWIKLFSKHLLSKFLILEIFAKLDYFMVWSLIRNIKWSLQWYSGRDLQTGIFKIIFFFFLPWEIQHWIKKKYFILLLFMMNLVSINLSQVSMDATMSLMQVSTTSKMERSE